MSRSKTNYRNSNAFFAELIRLSEKGEKFNAHSLSRKWGVSAALPSCAIKLGYLKKANKKYLVLKEIDAKAIDAFYELHARSTHESKVKNHDPQPHLFPVSETAQEIIQTEPSTGLPDPEPVETSNAGKAKSFADLLMSVSESFREMAYQWGYKN